MTELVMLKLGGSLITDKKKPYTARPDTIRRIAEEIKEAMHEKDIRLIVGHGGGSFPHQSATRYNTHKGITGKESITGIAHVQNDAATLNRIVVSALIEAGIDAVSIQPSSSVIAENSRIKTWDTKPLERYLELGMVPVPYGDVGLDTAQGSCILSTEEILTFLAKKLGSKKIILAGDTDGVYTEDGRLIPEITEKNFNNIRAHLKGSAAKDATGGMLHKVGRMLEFAGSDITSVILNGNIPGNLKKAILGKNPDASTTIK